jgi:hypothetical protein
MKFRSTYQSKLISELVLTMLQKCGRRSQGPQQNVIPTEGGPAKSSASKNQMISVPTAID